MAYITDTAAWAVRLSSLLQAEHGPVRLGGEGIHP